MSLSYRQVGYNDQNLTGLSTAEGDLENHSPALRLSGPTKTSPLYPTTNTAEWTQNFAMEPIYFPRHSGLTATPEYRTFPSAQSSPPDSMSNPSSWNLNEPIFTTQHLPTHPLTTMPQFFSIDPGSVQSDPSGMTRILTTRATHLPNLHAVKHVPQPGKSQFGIQDTTLEFLTHFGGPGEDAGKGIVVDEKGNSYITGYYDTRDPNQGTDVFVAKLDPAGKNLIWFVTFGGPGRDEGHGIARDKQGNLYVTGFIDTGDPNRGTDAFVAKLDPDGNFIYQPLLIGGPGNDSGNGITVNDAGEAYITGVLRESGSSYHTLIARVQANGSDVVYAIEDSPSGRNSIGNGIGVDAKGNIYIAGQLAFSDPHVFKYSAGDGSEPPTFAWGYIVHNTEQWPGSANSMVVAPDGTYYWAGEIPTHHPMDFDSLIGKGGPGGISDIIYLTGSISSRGFAVAYDAGGNGYLAGSWNTTPTTTTAFIDEFSPNGLPILNHFVLQQGSLAVYSVVLHNGKPNPNAYLTGTLDTRNPDQGIDAFVAKVRFD